MGALLLTGCLLIRNNKVLLLRRKGLDFWELPGGKVEDGKEPEAVVVETTKLQTGLDAEIIQQFEVLGYQKDGNTVEEVIFECSVPETCKPEVSEGIEEADWFSLEDAKKVPLSEAAQAALSELH